MACTYDDLRHTEVLTADFADVTGFDISLEGQVYTITSKGSGDDKTFLFGDEELDIRGLETALTAVNADEFTDESPSQKEELGMTVTLDSETHPKVQIEFYRYDGEHCLAVVDGTPLRAGSPLRRSGPDRSREHHRSVTILRREPPFSGRLLFLLSGGGRAASVQFFGGSDSFNIQREFSRVTPRKRRARIHEKSSEST